MYCEPAFGNSYNRIPTRIFGHRWIGERRVRDKDFWHADAACTTPSQNGCSAGRTSRHGNAMNGVPVPMTEPQGQALSQKRLFGYKISLTTHCLRLPDRSAFQAWVAPHRMAVHWTDEESGMPKGYHRAFQEGHGANQQADSSV